MVCICGVGCFCASVPVRQSLMSVSLLVLPSVKCIVHPGLCFAYHEYVGVCASFPRTMTNCLLSISKT